MKISSAIVKRFFKYVNIAGKEECWLWQGTKHSFGYGEMWVGERLERAHRIAWEIFVDQIPSGLCVLHHCDNPPCVNPDHLFLGTKADNTLDMCRKGRSANGTTKLTMAQVRQIRGTIGLQREIAQRFEISQSQVCRIKRGKRWREDMG